MPKKYERPFIPSTRPIVTVRFDDVTMTWPPRPDAKTVTWMMGKYYQEPPEAKDGDIWYMEPSTRRERLARKIRSALRVGEFR